MRKIFTGLFILITSLAVCIADDLPNRLMELDFEPISSDLVNVVVKTERPYNDNISITKKDAYNYVVTLPNTESLAPNPDWSKTSKIESVSIRTVPASGSGNGYTKITIKTNSNMSFIGKNTIYEKSDRPDDINRRREPNVMPPPERREQLRAYQNNNSSRNTSYSSERREREQTSYQRTERAGRTENPQTYVKPKTADKVEEEIEKEIVIKDELLAKRQERSKKDQTDKFLIVLGIILVIFVSIYCYIRAKNKLTDIVGEKLEIDVEEENKNKKKEEPFKKSHGSVKEKIRELDKKYPNPASISNISAYNHLAPVMSSEKSTDDMNIVDLDALFNEQKTQEKPDENDALEDFLNDFSFDEVNDREHDDEQEELYKVDENKYNSVINDDTLKFTQNDMECIEQIMSSDISSETLDNINKYAATNPIKETPRPSLDELVASYTISQNITFTGEDIKALDKLMRVELDDDFVKDLRTDPKRLAAMEKEMREFENFERKKPGEIQTLKVADLLPNLSDVLANPSKYAEKEEPKAEVDESALWKNIENVTFKPFDDGTREFEVLNTFDEETQENVIELYTKDFLEEKNKKTNDLNNKQEVKEPLQTKEAALKSKPKKEPVQTKEIAPKEEPKKESKPETDEVDNKPNLKCIMDGKTYNVLSSIALVKGIGCHLAKSDDGYSVLSYSGNNVSLLKHYPTLKSEKIQARLSEKLGNGEYRFIIRMGNVKFVAELKNRRINYVMDL